MVFHLLAETLSEDEDDIIMTTGDSVSVTALPDYDKDGSDFIPSPGGPFSALTPSMWPQDILQSLNNTVSTSLLIDVY